MNQRGFLAADECARPEFDLNIEIESASHDISAEKTVFFRLPDRVFKAFDRQRIFRADVDDACLRSDRITADRHCLQHRVGIALQYRTVHECAGVAFVGVADDELFSRGLLRGELPLASRGEASASAPAQT